MVMKTEELAMKETADSGELSVSEIHTLVAVGRHNPKTMSTIAQDLLINVSTLSIAINKLEKKGFVVRIRDDADRRIVPHQSRRKGVPLLSATNSSITKSWMEAIRDMDNQQKRVLVRSMSHMADFFSAKLNRTPGETAAKAD